MEMNRAIRNLTYPMQYDAGSPMPIVATSAALSPTQESGKTKAVIGIHFGYVRVCIYVCVCMYVCVYMFVFVCTYVMYVCVYMYVYVYVCNVCM
jgi:hypothetical protein